MLLMVPSSLMPRCGLAHANGAVGQQLGYFILAVAQFVQDLPAVLAEQGRGAGDLSGGVVEEYHRAELGYVSQRRG